MDALDTINSTNVVPSEAQKRFMDLKFGMFVHFGINTFHGREISQGDLPLHNFDAATIDTNQWCMTAWNSGMKYILITAKSIDGFCNWPTRYSHYSVRNTPYKKDILAQLVDSANKYGLKVGFSFSLWDNHVFNSQLAEETYNDFILKQVHELLTGYGPLVELWFDGFWLRQSHGWKAESGYAVPTAQFIRNWRMEGAYRWKWDYLYGYCKSIQPDCLIFNNPTRLFRGVPLFPVDGRAAERGEDLEEDNTLWYWLGKQVFLPLQIETTLSQKGEGNFADGYWFWHRSDNSVAKKWKIRSWKRNAEKIGANLLLNVGPMSNGKLRPEDEKVLLKFQTEQ